MGIAGSLRKTSCNKALLQTAAGLMPENTAFETFNLEGIPPFNQDLEEQLLQEIKEIKTKIRGSDASLIATPEYNYSISGVLKIAID